VLQCAQEVADTLRQTHPNKLHGHLPKHAQFVFSTLSSSSRLSQRSYVFTVEHLIIADGMYKLITIMYEEIPVQRSVHDAADYLSSWWSYTVIRSSTTSACLLTVCIDRYALRLCE
jgi:hypothetical protein